VLIINELFYTIRYLRLLIYFIFYDQIIRMPMQTQHIIYRDIGSLPLVLDDYLVLCMEYGCYVRIPIYLKKNV
jgi:hypothetical protein